MLKTCTYGVYNPTIDEVEPCGNLVEGNTTMCASHNAFFRKLEKQNLKAQEKRNTLIAKQREKNQAPRAKISKVSPKREEINKEYFKLVEQFKKDEPICQARIFPGCTRETEDVHHKRGRVGTNLADTSGWLAVCRNCHIYIENHPKEAIEKGWSESRLATTEPHKI